MHFSFSSNGASRAAFKRWSRIPGQNRSIMPQAIRRSLHRTIRSIRGTTEGLLILTSATRFPVPCPPEFPPRLGARAAGPYAVGRHFLHPYPPAPPPLLPSPL